MVFDEGPGSPGMSDCSNNCLRARVDMDVLDDNPLLSATAMRPTNRHRNWGGAIQIARAAVHESGCGPKRT